MAADAQTALHSDRALLGVALMLSLPHAAAQHTAAGPSPLLAQNGPGAQSGPAIDRQRDGAPIPGTGDSGAGARAPTSQGGPNGPDDRNAGSGGPTGGTAPTESPGASGSASPGASSGGASGSGSESNGGNQRSPAPQQ